MAAKETEYRIQDNLQDLTRYIKTLNLSESKLRKYLETNQSDNIVSTLKTIKDPRQSSKILYPLHNLLLIALLTVLALGNGSFLKMEKYAKSQRWKLKRLGIIKESIPSHDTFRRLFTLIDPSEIHRALIQPLIDFLHDVARPDLKSGLVHLMFDGKTMNGTGRSKQTKKPRHNTNMLNVYNGSFRLCLLSVPVREKSNEIPMVKCLLRLLKTAGHVITFDALHTQVETARLIHSGKGIYVTPVKRNQSGLFQDLSARLNTGDRKVQAEMIPRGGRVFEIIRFQPEWDHHGFVSGKLIVRMTSTKHDKNQPEIMIFISNTLDKELVMEAIEQRWGIEGGFHQDKDSELINEDKIRITDTLAQTNIVMINNTIAGILRWLMIFDEGMDLNEAKVNLKCHPLEVLNIIYGMASRDLESL